jgi:hypothetical protein
MTKVGIGLLEVDGDRIVEPGADPGRTQFPLETIALWM